MKWEELTSDELAELAGRKDSVVILPVGSLEKHGPHLPLGTDGLTVYKLAVEAAEREPAIVMPPLFYAYTPNMRQFPGAICIEEDTMVKLLFDICGEISRNGFKKILILNGHGGNIHLLRVFASSAVRLRVDYALYVIAEPWSIVRDVIDRVRETDRIGHAGEVESSYMMYLYPELCRMDRVSKPAQVNPKPLGEHPIVTQVDWIVYCPEGYVGDPRKASYEKGRVIVEAYLERLVEILKLVKRDEIVESTVKTLREAF